jgi:hypothetical protein
MSYVAQPRLIRVVKCNSFQMVHRVPLFLAETLPDNSAIPQLYAGKGYLQAVASAWVGQTKKLDVWSS